MATNNSESFFEAVENRRSYYVLSDKSSISDAKLKEVVERAVKHAPTSFNMQSSRVVLVTGQKNKEMWKLIGAAHKNLLGGDEEQEKQHQGKMDSFSAGYGSVLFFEDDEVLNNWIGNMPALAQAFPVWGQHQTGILHYIVWTALEKEGLGASLQHYGEYSAETKAEICKFFDIPQSWKNTAIMPFGVATAGPGNPAHPKTFEPLEKRVKVFFDASNTGAAPVETPATSEQPTTAAATSTPADSTSTSTPAQDSTSSTAATTDSSAAPAKKQGFLAKLKDKLN